METVLSDLKAMGKATAIEIAARTGMEREQVVRDLWELKRNDVACRVGGAWKLLDDDSQADEPEEPAATAEPQPTEKIGEPEITAVLRLDGPKTAEELAARFGTTARKIASTLAMAVSRGRLQRVSQGGKFRYDLPVTVPAAETAGEPVPAAPEPAVELVLTGETHHRDPDDLSSDMGIPISEQNQSVVTVGVTETIAEPVPVVPVGFQTCTPDLREINREIRRAESRLRLLYKLRDATHVVRRHGGIMTTQGEAQ